MIIDFHTHIFPDKIAKPTIDMLAENSDARAYTSGTRESLLESMREALVDISIVLPVVTRPGQYASINRFAREVTTEEYQPGEAHLVSFGGIHPETDNYKREIDEIASMGLLGIKLHPDYQQLYIDDIKYLRIIDRAAEKGLIISVHGGRDVGIPGDIHCTPKRVLNLLKQVDPDKLVVAHMGGFDCWDQVEDSLVGRKLYFDTGYSLGIMPDDQFLRIVRAHGGDKILFATDSPWSGQKESIACLKNIGLKTEEEHAIFSDNAVKLLRS